MNNDVDIVHYISPQTPNIRRIMNQPIYPQYVLPGVRFRTFLLLWSEEFSMQPPNLTKYGFFYTGKSNHLICYSCGGGFKNLTRLDNIDKLHAQFYGDCNHLTTRLTIKGVRELSQQIDADSDKFLDKQQTKTFIPTESDIPNYIQFWIDSNAKKDAKIRLLKKKNRKHIRELKRKNRRKLNQQRITMQRQVDTASKALECPICFSENVSFALTCGHSYCKDCIDISHICPLCRQISTEKKQFYTY